MFSLIIITSLIFTSLVDRAPFVAKQHSSSEATSQVLFIYLFYLFIFYFVLVKKNWKRAWSWYASFGNCEEELPKKPVGRLFNPVWKKALSTLTPFWVIGAWSYSRGVSKRLSCCYGSLTFINSCWEKYQCRWKGKKPKIVKISLFMKWEFKITKPFLVNLIQQFAILLLLTVFKTVEYNRLY